MEITELKLVVDMADMKYYSIAFFWGVQVLFYKINYDIQIKN